MTIEEHKEFAVESSSLKEIRSFAREVLAKDPIFQNSKDDVVLALAEAAQNIRKDWYCLVVSEIDQKHLGSRRLTSK